MRLKNNLHSIKKEANGMLNYNRYTSEIMNNFKCWTDLHFYRLKVIDAYDGKKLHREPGVLDIVQCAPTFFILFKVFCLFHELNSYCENRCFKMPDCTRSQHDPDVLVCHRDYDYNEYYINEFIGKTIVIITLIVTLPLSFLPTIYVMSKLNKLVIDNTNDIPYRIMLLDKIKCRLDMLDIYGESLIDTDAFAHLRQASSYPHYSSKTLTLAIKSKEINLLVDQLNTFRTHPMLLLLALNNPSVKSIPALPLDVILTILSYLSGTTLKKSEIDFHSNPRLGYVVGSSINTLIPQYKWLGQNDALEFMLEYNKEYKPYSTYRIRRKSHSLPPDKQWERSEVDRLYNEKLESQLEAEESSDLHSNLLVLSLICTAGVLSVYGVSYLFSLLAAMKIDNVDFIKSSLTESLAIMNDVVENTNYLGKIENLNNAFHLPPTVCNDICSQKYIGMPPTIENISFIVLPVLSLLGATLIMERLYSIYNKAPSENDLPLDNVRGNVSNSNSIHPVISLSPAAVIQDLNSENRILSARKEAESMRDMEMELKFKIENTDNHITPDETARSTHKASYNLM